jgi:hypothetical protein
MGGELRDTGRTEGSANGACPGKRCTNSSEAYELKVAKEGMS